MEEDRASGSDGNQEGLKYDQFGCEFLKKNETELGTARLSSAPEEANERMRTNF